jgi:hypothetical protein
MFDDRAYTTADAEDSAAIAVGKDSNQWDSTHVKDSTKAADIKGKPKD